MQVKNLKKFLIILNVLICCNIYDIYAEDLKITSQSAIVMEVSTGRVLYAKNIQAKRKIASTTKLMTAIIVMDNCNTYKLISPPIAVSICLKS